MKVVIVHGIPGDEERAKDVDKRSYDKHWMPWIEDKLNDGGIECIRPLMPEPWNPDYGNWKGEFEKVEIDDDDILIGHSGGCAFLVRWLGETERNVKKLILVAPWKIQSKDFPKGENDLYDFEIDKKVGGNVGNKIVFTADDEEDDGKESANIYTRELNAELIELKGKGHYCFGDMGTNEFPELLKEILG